MRISSLLESDALDLNIVLQLAAELLLTGRTISAADAMNRFRL